MLQSLLEVVFIIIPTLKFKGGFTLELLFFVLAAVSNFLFHLLKQL